MYHQYSYERLSAPLNHCILITRARMHIPTMTMVVLGISEIILLINTVILLSRNGDESTNIYLRDKNAVIWLLLTVSV